MSYKEWLEAILHLKDKVVLPNGKTISKAPYVTASGFSHVNFQGALVQAYNDYLTDNKNKINNNKIKK